MFSQRQDTSESEEGVGRTKVDSYYKKLTKSFKENVIDNFNVTNSISSYIYNNTITTHAKSYLSCIGNYSQNELYSSITNKSIKFKNSLVDNNYKLKLGSSLKTLTGFIRKTNDESENISKPLSKEMLYFTPVSKFNVVLNLAYIGNDIRSLFVNERYNSSSYRFVFADVFMGTLYIILLLFLPLLYQTANMMKSFLIAGFCLLGNLLYVEEVDFLGTTFGYLFSISVSFILLNYIDPNEIFITRRIMDFHYREFLIFVIITRYTYKTLIVSKCYMNKGYFEIKRCKDV
ncbi:hypothetical protein CANARDRAFT_191750 [[Candida] arabinofermentans NRRL YB-2248]|uniref:Uncharacterized protein n=1 Tax=[Candida] arabinofermentans NRRL YB-2248 TaxID=983967 RepID=A0A1E4T821_9ASCO|nr:hypothetical protein CANARDRAFT_191750 [[Candida] arabinofermentans NRRL YB-2248]